MKLRTALLILLLGIFLLPWLIARWIYHHPHLLFTQKTNRGELIIPPVSITLFPIKNSAGQLLDNTLPNQYKSKPPASKATHSKWMILLFYPGHCDLICFKKLYYLRQIRIAMGKNQARVERAILTYQPWHHVSTQHIFERDFAGTQHWFVSQSIFEKSFPQKINLSYALSPGVVYLVDPLGYIMMAYQPNANPEDILKDLQHLLMISQIG